MKPLYYFFILVAAFTLNACSKKSGATIPDMPRSDVPDAFTGNWLSGTFAMSDWWSYNGTQYDDNPYTQSVAFTFNKSGDAEFYLALASFDGACRAEAFTYYKGTVTFNESDHSFTLYPQQGNFRGFYSCNRDSNFDRTANSNELNPSTLYYTIETDSNGKEWMVIRFSTNPNEAGTYFQSTTW
ncbi:hypothetical protein FC093_16845 [Ilyomonas limi]|uniref:Lipocalin-like domain-containing protein n=1 Tax=Ilyomonas limi TaxID=2575867 RepID=A0A4U3KWE8_9BACT|nr:hypothetical protein [Ilyomonas limi]TKK66702.1 hypothetical protein FC093_16845 [Ilyomonas limi]